MPDIENLELVIMSNNRQGKNTYYRQNSFVNERFTDREEKKKFVNVFVKQEKFTNREEGSRDIPCIRRKRQKKAGI